MTSHAVSQIPHSKPTLEADDRRAIDRTLTSGMIAAGTLTRQFETQVAARLGLRGGLAVASGTDALIAALLALGVSRGDEVIMPTYVCDAVRVAIQAVGATAVLCDVGEDRCMARHTVAPHITPRTRAVIVVHPFGAVADVDDLRGLGLRIVEDCCQAFAAMRDGRPAGTRGDACVLSFHATKLLTTGEGGMVLSGDPGVVQRLEAFRRTGGDDSYRVSPLSDLQAALGLSQLARYDRFLERRREIADHYFDQLDGLAVRLPVEVRGRSIFFRFPLRVVADFETIRGRFAEAGIHVRRGVDRLIHDRTEAGRFPVSERLFAETVCVPIYPALTRDEAGRIVAAARRIFGEGA